MGIKIKQVSATGSIKFINSVTGLTFKKITSDWSLSTDDKLNKQIRFQRGDEFLDINVEDVIATMIDSTETAFSGTAEQLITATESFFVKAPASSGGGGTTDLPISTKTANYTLVLADAHTMINMNLAGANTLTIPLNSSVAFPVGTEILISQEGAGQTTLTPIGGVTLNSAGGKLKSNVQYSGITLVKKATDVWAVFGDLTT